METKLEPVKLDALLVKGKMKTDPAFKELTAGLTKRFKEIIDEEFASCCIQGCCVSWCCVQLH